jgi:phosphoribosyl-ATP pyrophosphohydrolase/phosphoribosyl-AMP cyclohydrolase
MVAWMNQEALSRTLSTGKATFFSRSRQALWEKGESSGHSLRVRQVAADCDGDVLLLLVDPEGPSCHTGRPNCFFHAVQSVDELVEQTSAVTPFLPELEALIRARTESTAEKSYTRSLLDGGAPEIGAKLREEADELARAIADESEDRVASEAADLMFHALVGLRARGVPVRAVLDKLASRMGQSGHAEKASRGR